MILNYASVTEQYGSDFGLSAKELCQNYKKITTHPSPPPPPSPPPSPPPPPSPLQSPLPSQPQLLTNELINNKYQNIVEKYIGNKEYYGDPTQHIINLLQEIIFLLKVFLIIIVLLFVIKIFERK